MENRIVTALRGHLTKEEKRNMAAKKSLKPLVKAKKIQPTKPLISLSRISRNA